MLIISLLGYLRDKYTYISANIVIQFSALLQVSGIFTVIFSYNQSIYVLIVAWIGWLTNFILGIILLIIYCKNIAVSDNGYQLWKNNNKCSSGIIYIL